MHTSTFLRAGWFAALWVAALSPATPPVAAQEASGPDVWAANCGSCHRLRSLDAYTASQWNSIATHMALVARLTPAETRAVREFLVSSARARQAATTMQELVPGLPALGGGRSGGGANALDHESANSGRAPECCPVGAGRDLFRTRCAACHGPEGRGNGLAAASMNPRPTNFSDQTQRTAVTDSAARAVIESGRRGMPAFGQMLSQAQLDTLVFFLRSFRP